MRALCVICVCFWWLCPPSPPPPIFFLSFFFALYLLFFPLLFFVCFLFFKWKGGRVHTAGTGMGNLCSSAVVLHSPVCVVGASSVAATQGCGSRVLMYMGAGQGGFG